MGAKEPQSPARIAISRGVGVSTGKRECCNPRSAFLHPHQPDFPGERGVWSFVLGVFMDWSVFVTFSTTPVNVVYKNLLEDFEGAMKS